MGVSCGWRGQNHAIWLPVSPTVSLCRGVLWDRRESKGTLGDGRDGRKSSEMLWDGREFDGMLIDRREFNEAIERESSGTLRDIKLSKWDAEGSSEMIHRAR